MLRSEAVPGKLALVVLFAIASVRVGHADTPVPEVGGPVKTLSKKIAVWRFDALGIETELVVRLETLFRLELERLVKTPLPSRREIDRVVTARDRECTGEARCLAAIGKKLGVDVIVTGTVGSMGDSYIVNIKAVDTATAKVIQRLTTDPLRGSPDELIEGVRVAAYRLLAPDQLYGSLQVQSDLVGAEVRLDGKTIGKTPLPRLGVISKLPLGKHQLVVSAKDYTPFEERVDVRFQKVSQVVVRLLPSKVVIDNSKPRPVQRRPFYTRTWFIVGAGVAAIVVGGVVGASIGRVKCVDGVTGGDCP